MIWPQLLHVTQIPLPHATFLGKKAPWRIINNIQTNLLGEAMWYFCYYYFISQGPFASPASILAKPERGFCVDPTQRLCCHIHAMQSLSPHPVLGALLTLPSGCGWATTLPLLVPLGMNGDLSWGVSPIFFVVEVGRHLRGRQCLVPSFPNIITVLIWGVNRLQGSHKFVIVSQGQIPTRFLNGTF